MKGPLTTAAVAAAVFAPAATYAQDENGVQMRENVTYYSMVFIDYKPGKTAEAREIIEQHFGPVAAQVGQDNLAFQAMTGEWDDVVFFPLGPDTDALDYVRSPSNAEWWAAFAEQEGGQEQAQSVMDEWAGLVTRSERHIVYQHNANDE